MVTLRGENPEEILRLVREVETASVDVGVGQNSPDRGYASVHLEGDWLHIDRQPKRFSRAVMRTMRALLAGKFREAASAVRFGRVKPTGRTNVSASRIRVKNNVLAIYPDIGFVAKFEKPTSIREPNSLHNEFVVLSDIAAFDGLQAPVPIAFQSQPVPTLWMKHVDHRKVAKECAATFAHAIAANLLEWYEHSGVTQITPDSYKPLTNHLADGIPSIVQKGWSKEEAKKIYSLLEIIAESRTPLFLSRIHGDASTGNAMITPSGNLVINDWENSRLDIVGFDMLKLSSTNPEVLNLYSQWRSNLAGTIAADTAKELALVRILNGVDVDYHWRYLTKVRKWNYSQAQSLIVAGKRSIMELCDSFGLRN